MKLRNGLIVTVNSKHDIPIIWEVIGTRCYGRFLEVDRKATLTVVDIGANIGLLTLLALLELPNAHVYSYEPQSANFLLLNKNVSDNNFKDRVTLTNKAVAGKVGKRLLHIATGGDSGHHSFEKSGINTTETETVECTTLDNIINEVGEIDFLKIDVEGAEEEIIKSCTQLSKIKNIKVEGFYEPMVEYA